MQDMRCRDITKPFVKQNIYELMRSPEMCIFRRPLLFSRLYVKPDDVVNAHDYKCALNKRKGWGVSSGRYILMDGILQKICCSLNETVVH